MACKCIERQQKLVDILCRSKPDGWLCRQAQQRLEKMQARRSQKK